MLDAKQIAEIVRQADRDDEVTPSTLHYYVQAGIVPPAVGRGRSAYTPEHLARFRLARQLKREGLSLAEIRERVARTPVRALPADPLSASKSQAAAGPAPAHARADLLTPGPATPRPDTPRTLRFKGGFSLQVPAGTSDEQVARLYSAIETLIDKETRSREGK
jgi:DNA-binding transcriptional MerR regulator